MKRFQIYSISLMALLLLLAAGQASALEAYMTLTGETQGAIQGCSDRAGHEDEIQITAFGHNVISPRDAASGLPTGKRQHKPLTVRMDAACGSTPLLYAVLVNNENITELSIRFWRNDPTGQPTQVYTVLLEGASIAGISSAGAGVDGLTELVVSFAYQKITWTFEDGGITAEDDWETPVS